MRMSPCNWSVCTVKNSVYDSVRIDWNGVEMTTAKHNNTTVFVLLGFYSHVYSLEEWQDD